MPFVPTQSDLTRALAILDSTEAAPLALITTSVLAKTEATTAAPTALAPTLLDPSIARATLDSTGMVSIALITMSVLAKMVEISVPTILPLAPTPLGLTHVLATLDILEMEFHAQVRSSTHLSFVLFSVSFIFRV